MKIVMIYPNIRKIDTAEAFREIYALLRERNAKVIAPYWAAKFINSSDVEFYSVEECVKISDFIIVLGGDGTILRIAKEAAEYRIPIIGINYGHLGFVTELESSDIKMIHRIFDGNYYLDKRIMLDVCVFRDDAKIFTSTALNDVILTNGTMFKIIKVQIYADGVPVSAFRGDGVVISTPTGSTAYSIAAGGPVVEPTSENISVTPICAHEVQAKAYVFSSDRKITVKAKSYSDKNAYLSVDGRETIEIFPDDIIRIQRSGYETKLIRVKRQSIYHVIREKLSGGGNVS